jgi:hypothetical protein
MCIYAVIRLKCQIFTFLNVQYYTLWYLIKIILCDEYVDVLVDTLDSIVMDLSCC